MITDLETSFSLWGLSVSGKLAGPGGSASLLFFLMAPGMHNTYHKAYTMNIELAFSAVENSEMLKVLNRGLYPSPL